MEARTPTEYIATLQSEKFVSRVQGTQATLKKRGILCPYLKTLE